MKKQQQQIVFEVDAVSQIKYNLKTYVIEKQKEKQQQQEEEKLLN